MIGFLRSIYLTPRFFAILGVFAVAFTASHFYPDMLFASRLLFYGFIAIFLLDCLLLYRLKEGLLADREMLERMSNGDENPVSISVQNKYAFKVLLEVIDEIPFQFQARDVSFKRTLKPGERRLINYNLRPTERGVYEFGRLMLFASSELGLIKRRYQFCKSTSVPVYPSFLQMRTFEIMAASNRLHEIGVKKIRRIGQAVEFDRIKEYVVGDDPRTVNWKATARHGSLMVNQYQDEREQPMYCLLDVGRVMEMPFNGLSLLDYSINASLVIGNIALKKQDRVGLLSFSNTVGSVLRAEAGMRQLGNIMERLYALDTGFLESDFEQLHSAVRHHIRQRSLLLLFTNFESLTALKRQLPYLKALARIHLLVVIFFENTELTTLASQTSKDTEAIYIKTIASQFMLQKHEIVMELRKHGIQSVLTKPENLSVNTLNKYLELKARGLF